MSAPHDFISRAPVALVALACTALALSCAADADHEKALRLRQAGMILPLQDVVARVVAEAPARILEVELERVGDDYVYEVVFLDAGGALRRLWLDARTGQAIESPEGDLR